MNPEETNHQVRLTSGVWSGSIQLDELKALVLEPSADFWDRGSQDIIVQFAHDELTAKLILVYSEANGFYAMCGTTQQWSDGEYLIAVTSTTQSKRATEIWVGGDKVELPRRLLLSPNECWTAVTTFWDTGQPDLRIRWELLSEELYETEDA